jgi:hypothetical protein
MDMEIVHSLKRILTGTEFLLPFIADAKGLTTLWLVLGSCYLSERFHPPRFNATCRGLKKVYNSYPVYYGQLLTKGGFLGTREGVLTFSLTNVSAEPFL